MTNRAVFLILGLVIIGIAFGGFYFFQQYQQQQTEIQKLEAIAEKERQKARQAEEARKEQEERKLAEERRKQAERERIRRLERERQIERERRAEAERIRRQKAAEAERRRLVEAERKRQQAEAERRRAAQKRAARTIKIRFTMKASDSKEIPVALVRKGDQVRVDIKRFGGADYKIFAGVVPIRLFKSLQRSRSARAARRTEIMYYAKGPDGAPTLVTMPLKDHDRFGISSDVNSFHPRRLGVNKRKDGNVLFIGTGLGGGIISNLFEAKKGSFEVSVEIYAKNRWGLKARSLL